MIIEALDLERFSKINKTNVSNAKDASDSYRVSEVRILDLTSKNLDIFQESEHLDLSGTQKRLENLNRCSN